MEENENGTGLQQFRSSYLTGVRNGFDRAEARDRLHTETLKLAEKNYKGDALRTLVQEENSQYSSAISQILRDIDALAARESSRLAEQKRTEVTATGEKEMAAISRIDRLSDILTREEMQAMADEYRDFTLVQRKLSKASDRRGFAIDTYPGIDQKMETVQQIAADMKGFISAGDFGLAPGIYMKISFPEYDDILSPMKKEETIG